MKINSVIFSILCGLLLPLSGQEATTKNSPPKVTKEHSKPLINYTRKLVRYEKGDQVVDLLGMVHVYDQRLYDEANAILKANTYDAILYEGVKGEHKNIKPLKLGKLYQWLTKASGLALQKLPSTAQRKDSRFIHADIDLSQLSDEQAEQLKKDLNQMRVLEGELEFRKLHGELRKGIKDLQKLMELTDDEIGLFLKVLILRMTGEQMEHMISGGNQRKMVLNYRNTVCFNCLKQQLAKKEVKKVAIIYGSAHMPGLSKHIESLGFKRVKVQQLYELKIPELKSPKLKMLAELMTQMLKNKNKDEKQKKRSEG